MIKLKNVERYNPNIEIGLTTDQVKKRIEEDLVNHDTTIPTKSIKRIIYENFFTLFNIINIILAICILCVKSYKNMLFLLIVIINTAISTIQEIHSKKVVDKLSIMSSSKVSVIRNKIKKEIDINNIVLDDLINLSTGNQVVVDSIIKSGTVLVNESFITGEPNSITKKVGDIVNNTLLNHSLCLVFLNRFLLLYLLALSPHFLPVRFLLFRLYIFLH